MSIPVHCANTVLTNKTGLVARETLDEVRASVGALAPPGALIAACQYGEIDAAIVFGERPVYFTAVTSRGHAHAHSSPGHNLESVSFEMAARFDFDGLSRLLHELEGRMVRAKGIVSTDQGEKLVQSTQTGMAIRDWERPVEVSRLVFSAEDLDKQDMECKLRALTL